MSIKDVFPEIAIVGGSGLDNLDELQRISTALSDTPWGRPSESPAQGLFSGVSVLFLPRHGSDHRLPPDKINYRANIAALAQLGVKSIIACNVVGAINPAMRTGDLVLPDQLIDYTWGRSQSFFDGATAVNDLTLKHIDFTHPFSIALRNDLLKAAQTSGIDIHPVATTAVTQGPRLETAAEISRLARDGCDIVGMTTMPEAALACEKGIAYASIALVVNPAAGLTDKPITEDSMLEVMVGGMKSLKALIAAYLHQQCL